MNTYQRLQELYNQPAEQKLKHAHSLIEEALSRGKAAIAWSGGKDSTVLLHMVRQHAPDILVVWNNTGVEFPETYKFVMQMKEEWNLNLIVAKPKVTFWWCVDRFGWPLLGKEMRSSSAHRRAGFHPTLSKRKRKASMVANISSYCCDYLKEKPMRQVCRAEGVEVSIVGCLVKESRQRQLVWLQLGDFYQRKKDKMWIAWPLAAWSDSEIWDYHRENDLPYCELYNMGHKRNGCWPCGMDIGFDGNHLSRLRVSHPKLWRHIIIDRGLGTELIKIKLALRDGQADMFSGYRIEKLLEQRPCYFDMLRGL